MYCRKCGAQLADGTKFCRYCGTEQKLPVSIEKDIASKEPASHAVRPAGPKKPRAAQIVGIILGVLLLVAAGAFIGKLVSERYLSEAPQATSEAKTAEIAKSDTQGKAETPASAAAESAKKNAEKAGSKTEQTAEKPVEQSTPAAPEKSTEELTYEEAESMLQSGRIVSAYNAFQKLGTYRDSASRAAAIKTNYPVCFTSVGNYVEFGSYEQNGKSGEEPIEWLVLEKGSDYVILISRYALANRLFHETGEAVTWGSSDLRYWLNNSFFNKAFSTEQQSMIAESSVITAGSTTYDKVYLLSTAEAESYFSSDGARTCKPTKAVTNSGAVTGSNGNIWWWLRSPGKSGTKAAGVFGRGAIDYDGDTMNYLSKNTGKAPNGVRPVIRVNID